VTALTDRLPPLDRQAYRAALTGTREHWQAAYERRSSRVGRAMAELQAYAALGYSSPSQ
jgi:hypothetical protein